MSTSRESTVSLRTLLILFMTIGVLLFIVIGLNLMLKVDQINEAVEAKRQADAQQEIRIAFRKLFRQAGKLGNQFSSWDEVQQQLVSPTYYAYWRNRRPHSSNTLPKYVTDIELYYADGQSLIQPHTSKLANPVPEKERYFAQHEGITYLFNFTPVYDRINVDKVIGYTGIMIDVMQALHSIHHFTYTRADSIILTDFDDRLLTVDNLLQDVSFKALDSPQSSELDALIKWNLVHFSALMVILIIAVHFILKHLISTPLSSLVQHINTLRQGADLMPENNDTTFVSILEIKTLQESFTRYHEELDSVHEKLDQQNVELWRMAHHDSLTGVYNRRAFEKDWHNLIEIFADQRISVSYMLFDCNHFKAINDTYGHETGDKLICAIAEVLQDTLRKGDKLYRLGGDEFVAIILNSEPDAVAQIAERCTQAIQNYPFNNLGINEPVTLCVGIASAQGTDCTELKAVPRHADLAMYHAKKSKLKIQQYSQKMGDEASILSSRIVNAVMHAVDSSANIQLHYQKILRADNQDVSFYEALVRLKDNDELIFPNDIFPIINRHSLDAEFDQAIVNAIQRDLENGVIPENTGVSINLSAASLTLPDLEQRLSGLLPFLQTQSILLEVTETSLISYLKLATANLRKLQDLGFLIALDDFGSGYSSIRYLANMPVDIVKFDIAMIQAMQKDQRTRQIVENVARLILDADYQLVAEGIEDHKTLELVIQMGATHLQGYLFGKPCRL